MATEKGVKLDQGKIRMDLFPLEVAESISKVLTFGAQKYTENGWQQVPDAVKRYQAAMLRHLTAIEKGELYDDESGLPHIYHVGCCVTFLIYFFNREEEFILESISI
jgi:hypothetical protein